VGEFVPAVVPFTFHSYEGEVPSLTGTALNVTDDPGQNGFEDVVMDIPTGKFELTVIVIGFDTDGFPVTQLKEEERMHVTLSLLVGI